MAHPNVTSEEAYKVLGIEPGASPEVVKAAYHAQAKAAHPDVNGLGSADAFHRVQEAYEAIVRRRVQRRLDEADGAEADAEGQQEPADAAVKLVTDFLERKGIEILFDGTLRSKAAPSAAQRADEIAGYLAVEEIDGPWLIDELMTEVRANRIKMRKTDVERAVRRLTREAQKARRQAIVEPLLMPDVGATDEAATAWSSLAATVFETDAALCVGCLQHFVWQVKRKLLGLPIRHHLMPVIWSPLQGGGKTTFVRKFLAPLRELATGPVLLSDFTDKRSGDIYRFPALFVDDMEQMEAKLIPVLKSLVTSEGLRRRKLGTSMSEGHRQRTTLIGTANSAIDALVADATGNRRFASLRFRNGKVETGGDAAVWPAIDTVDYGLLWRSVDVFGAGPIEAHLEALVALQETGQAPDPVLVWLRALDLMSARVTGIITRQGIKASDLHDLYCEQTNSTLTLTRFGECMRTYVLDPTVPFGPKVKKETGWYYPLKVAPASV
nr:primase-helicase family protein [Methylobacterium sp. L1A1]